ncbi:MAG TPA: AmmeMemoRadiSam system protein B [Candidatus Woesebacteria bacterium]|nr:AmmeMemoRadiSam system protein B [Candidatus Woesebacteria bacterium]
MSKIKLISIVLISSFIIFFCLVFIRNHKQPNLSPKYSGAILPHHILAKNLIDDFLNRLTYEPKKIYIIGPNHFEVGNSKIITDNNFETKNLQILSSTRVDSDIVSKEHSVKLFQDILSAKYPQSHIIPLVISSNISVKDVESLVDNIYQNFTDDTLLICSVDFSHYRTFPEAQKFDNKTIGLILNKDYSQITQLNNDYIDSPKSLIIFLKTLDKLNKNKITILNHSNSAIILNDPHLSSTTSYFELAFE